MTTNSNHVLIRRARDGRWLNFEKPVEIFQASNPGEVLPILDRIGREVERNGFYAAGFLSYEAGAAFDPAFEFRKKNSETSNVQHPTSNLERSELNVECSKLSVGSFRLWRPDLSSGDDFPLLWFGLFRKALPVDLPQVSEVGDWSPDWKSSVTEEEYKEAISRIKEYILRGETYQVNYTFRLCAPFSGNARQLFFHLVAGRNIPYAAFIESEKFAVCSLSPELFFELNGEEIVSRPMKGTMPRGLTQAEDESMAKRLSLSEKNRAENVMIADMVRNDLGRIAAADTVRAASLFDVEKHDTVWQTTSTVKARTLSGLTDVFKAMFPPASVTGAPKVNTMRIISGLETSPRKIYTGAIGFLAPGRRAQFNVAIRTLLIDKERGAAEYGVGGGIVWDSVGDAEYKECVLKAKILHETYGEFSLLETMLWSPEEKYFLLDLHLSRLKSSAEYFSFEYDEEAVSEKLDSLVKDFSGQPRRVRLLLARDGSISCRAKFCESDQKAEMNACLAKRNVASDNPFLYHKTTNRKIYDESRAECEGHDEVILWNEKGEVTEFCAGNIVVNLNGKMVTPPLACGLLPGTYRSRLLAEGKVTEQIVKKEDLGRAEEIYFCNSVRKMRKVKLKIGN